MKPQDIIFFIILLFLLWKGNSRVLAIAGMSCLVFAAPLFYLWIFFTAQRFTWYAGAFFLSGVIKQLLILRKTA